MKRRKQFEAWASDRSSLLNFVKHVASLWHLQITGHVTVSWLKSNHWSVTWLVAERVTWQIMNHVSMTSRYTSCLIFHVADHVTDHVLMYSRWDRLTDVFINVNYFTVPSATMEMLQRLRVYCVIWTINNAHVTSWLLHCLLSDGTNGSQKQSTEADEWDSGRH